MSNLGDKIREHQFEGDNDMSDVTMARGMETIMRGFIRCVAQVILGMCFGFGFALMLIWIKP